MTIAVAKPDVSEAFQAVAKRFQTKMDMYAQLADENPGNAQSFLWTQNNFRNRWKSYERLFNEPPEIFRVEAQNVSIADMSARRGLHNDAKVSREITKLKPRFHRMVVQGHRPALEKMDLTFAMIDNMEHGQVVFVPKDGIYLDVTLDHIQPMVFGGTHDFNNLRLIPEYLNVFFGKLIQYQMPRQSGLILNLEFKEGEDSVVPYVPGGFRIGSAKQRGAINKQRIQELLGWEPNL